MSVHRSIAYDRTVSTSRSVSRITHSLTNMNTTVVKKDVTTIFLYHKRTTSQLQMMRIPVYVLLIQQCSNMLFTYP